MNNKELKLIAELLELAADEFSCNGCTDWDFPKGWTKQEKLDIGKECAKIGGYEDEFDPKDIYIANYEIMDYLARKIKKEIKDNKKNLKLQ